MHARQNSLLVRFTSDERALLDANAREAGLSRASFIRASALGDPGPRARRAPTIKAEALALAVAALNKTSCNLQQVAGILKAGENAAVEECFVELAEATAAIRAAVKRNDRKGKYPQ